MIFPMSDFLKRITAKKKKRNDRQTLAEVITKWLPSSVLLHLFAHLYLNLAPIKPLKLTVDKSPGACIKILSRRKAINDRNSATRHKRSSLGARA